jgi:hypothetical protein
VDTSSLLGQPGCLPLSHSLVLDTPSFHLFSQVLGSGLLSLGLVDVLHQDSLVLEGVSLCLQVERVVQVLVDLAGLSVLSEQSSQDSHSSEPLNLGGHSGLGRTLSLTWKGWREYSVVEIHVSF